jgi:23S rRNA (pseudouridine1915-N3)-methyltransferase
MKLSIWAIGKTDEKFLEEGIKKYLDRLSHYTKVDYIEWKDSIKSSIPQDIMKKEADMVLKKLKPDDILIILDEKGLQKTSVEFAQFIEKLQNNSTKSCILLIGGAFGIHHSVKERAKYSISLSSCTFTHQMVRIILLEQLYRAYTIIKKEKYHNI